MRLMVISPLYNLAPGGVPAAEDGGLSILNSDKIIIDEIRVLWNNIASNAERIRPA